MKIKILEQFELLVAELEKNPSLAKGFKKGNCLSDIKGAWDAISAKLNSVGPPVRETDGWHKVWKDLKFKVKKKMVLNKSEATPTGGSVFKEISLLPLEEAVANLLQFEKLLSPQGFVYGGQKRNIEEIESEEQISENVELTENEETNLVTAQPASSSCKQTPYRKRTKKEEIMELVQKQTGIQEKNFDETCESLKAIEKKCQTGGRIQGA